MRARYGTKRGKSQIKLHYGLIDRRRAEVESMDFAAGDTGDMKLVEAAALGWPGSYPDSSWVHYHFLIHWPGPEYSQANA